MRETLNFLRSATDSSYESPPRARVLIAIIPPVRVVEVAVQNEVQELASDRRDTSIADSLEPGEWVVTFADCLTWIGNDELIPTVIALTPHRVLASTAAHLHSLPLGTTNMVQHQRRDDGSRILVIDGADATECLYFDPSAAEVADALVVAIRFFERA